MESRAAMTSIRDAVGSGTRRAGALVALAAAAVCFGLATLASATPPAQTVPDMDRLLRRMDELYESSGTRSQVEISVVGNELSVKLDRPDLVEEGAAYHRRERPSGSFTRVLRLPLEVDPDRVEAELSDGVLTITLPRAESAKPRTIRVTAAS